MGNSHMGNMFMTKYLGNIDRNKFLKECKERKIQVIYNFTT